MIKDIIGTVFLITGLLTGAIALIGVYKFKFVMNRIHSAAIIDTLSLSLLLIGLLIIIWDKNYIFKLLLILMFQWISSPIASHMVTRLEYETDKDINKHVRKERN